MNDDELTPEQREFIAEITGQPIPKKFRTGPPFFYDVPAADTCTTQIRVHDGNKWIPVDLKEVYVTNPLSGIHAKATTSVASTNYTNISYITDN